jgi:hypothetical protein
MIDALFAKLRPTTKAKLRVRLWEERDAQKVLDLLNLVFKEFNWQTFTGPGEIDEPLLHAGPYYESKGGYFMVLERLEEGKDPELIGSLAYYRNERDPLR